MKQKNNLIEDTKRDIVNSVINSKEIKIAKYIAIGLIATYGLGYVFKVLAFTKTNFNQLKRAIKA